MIVRRAWTRRLMMGLALGACASLGVSALRSLDGVAHAQDAGGPGRRRRSGPARPDPTGADHRHRRRRDR